MSTAAAAVSIGFINMWANLAGFLGNYEMGWLRKSGFSEPACLLALAGCYVVGGLLVAGIRVPPGRR